GAAGLWPSRARRSRRSSRAATSHPKRPLLSWHQTKMKPDIHPEYVLATVTCSCGHTFQTRSTKPELHVEICSNCHPFYTGKQQFVDTAGRGQRFHPRLQPPPPLPPLADAGLCAARRRPPPLRTARRGTGSPAEGRVAVPISGRAIPVRASVGNDRSATPVGGQAVLEGGRMRGPSNWAVAVRKP